jgi:hypothetical protein
MSKTLPQSVMLMTGSYYIYRMFPITPHRDRYVCGPNSDPLTGNSYHQYTCRPSPTSWNSQLHESTPWNRRWSLLSKNNNYYSTKDRYSSLLDGWVLKSSFILPLHLRTNLHLVGGNLCTPLLPFKSTSSVSRNTSNVRKKVRCMYYYFVSRYI